MKHYGDIKSINGSDLAPVDIIIGGSPCQNLSIAGNRQGLSGEQSSLFLEQIRVVKESRKYHGKPRFMLWENVPGALTCNSGEDFRRVLEETVLIKESVSISRPANGKWSNAGCIMGNGFSVAWRIHDAQYWGVPQRRRRIALVADFDGQCAGEILFEPKGLRGDSPKSGETRQEAAGIVDVCVNTDIERAMNVAGFISGASSDARGIGYESEKPPVLRAESNTACVVCSFDSLSSNGNGQADGLGEHDKVGALNCMHDQQAIVVTQETFIEIKNDVSPAIKASDYRRPNTVSHIDGKKYIIRRLTPLECERLQGYTDGWTDIGEWKDTKGKTHKTSDTARYKALGNSIALPFWHWLLNRFAPYLPESPTMGSLFDGIGGFPLCWERIYGKGTAVWASEIEPFCIAVTEKRFNAR